MNDEFIEKTYRIGELDATKSLSALEENLVGIPGVKFVDFEFPAVVLHIDVDPGVFKDSEAMSLLSRMGFTIEVQHKPERATTVRSLSEVFEECLRKMKLTGD
ncbi:MAG TPA: hypothetical protein PLQ76_08880 [bacterium]|nr:hypothetical protein [bacterium]